MDITSFLLGYESGKMGGVSSDGTGGGSLPAGLYWKYAGIKSATTSYEQLPFKLNGALYCLVGKSGTSSKYLYDIYKYDGSAWTKIITDAKNVGVAITGVELNGKVHFLNYNKDHYVFDGSAYTQMSELPVGTSGRRSAAFVHNGVLKYASYNPATVYAWDEATDTWTEEYQISTSSAYTYWGSVNGEIYFMMNSRMYRYTGSSHELVSDVDVSSFFNEMIAYDGCLYGKYRGNATTPTNVNNLARFDPATGTFTLLGPFPWNCNELLGFEHDGKLILLGTDAYKKSTAFTQFYKIEESTEE